ncbi:MAG: alpha-amylase family glycosyl hydrolase [Chitinophagaceae bacterium]
MKRLLITILLASVCAYTNAQLLAISPDFPTDNGSITITMDPTKGNKGLNGSAGPVFLHTGVITNLSTSQSDWKYVQGTWGTATAPQATLSGGKWVYTIPNIRTFYNVPAGETILKIAVLFRNQAGTLVQRNIDGSDMYLPVYTTGQFAVRFVQPLMQPMYVQIPEPISSATTSIAVQAVTSKNSTLTLNFKSGSGGSPSQIGSASNATSVSGTANATSTCEQQITVSANDGSTTIGDTINWFRPPASAPTGTKPSGVADGITFQDANTSAVFIINAPGKGKISLIGDFNNWVQTCDGLMKKDGNYFWTKITGLTPGQTYRFQYVVDDTIRVADPYSELVLDPYGNDRFISAATFPNMIPYPTGKTTGGFVGVIKPGDTYTWTDAGYVRPNKYNLNVYELLIRDFSAAQNYQTLRDTLPYLARLGINCIELMPVNEFDGNNSWGYNPSYFFALDKAYGTKKAFKDFINDAHKYGIAVVVDAVWNHATGNSAMATMWWNKATSQPTSDNPYMYVTAQHPFNVYNDFNHNSAMTKYMCERYIEYWLTEYKIDGFRWDLSKGFTTQNYGSDVAAWGSYSQGRIDLLSNYYNKIQAVSSGAYSILEHLGADNEEYELAARGMLLWGKMTSEFAQNTMGYSSNSDISRAYWINRSTWSNAGNVTYIADKPGLVVYAESHDEERIMYSTLTNGNTSNGAYNVKTLAVALPRAEAMAAILLAIPGPKMIWQFGEVGYDFSITRCENGTLSSSCNTNPKPVRWDYWTAVSPNYRRRLYETYAAMNKLRLQKPNAFNNTTITTGTNLGTDLWKVVVLNHSSLKMVVVANFDVNSQTRSVTFPTAGTYYDYTRGGTFTSFGSPQNVTLGAGEYRVWIDQNITGGVVTGVRDQIADATNFKLDVFPNPVQQNAYVRYELPKSGKVSIQLMNIQGQVLATRNLGFQLKGLQVFEFDRSNFGGSTITPGSYILQVRVDNMVRYEKIMVQR